MMKRNLGPAPQPRGLRRAVASPPRSMPHGWAVWSLFGGRGLGHREQLSGSACRPAAQFALIATRRASRGLVRQLLDRRLALVLFFAPGKALAAQADLAVGGI